MKKFRAEDVNTEATTKESGKIKSAIGSVAQFGKDHWKGIAGAGAVGGIGLFVKKRFFPSADNAVDFEQDTIDGAREDFGVDYSEPNLGEVGTETTEE